jgi:hypothetical protein
MGLELLARARLDVLDNQSNEPTADAITPPESIAA